MNGFYATNSRNDNRASDCRDFNCSCFFGNLYDLQRSSKMNFRLRFNNPWHYILYWTFIFGSCFGFVFLLASCACINSDTAFGMDGKAFGWCKRKHKSEKLCKAHDGLKNYSYAFAECKDGKTFTDEVEK